MADKKNDQPKSFLVPLKIPVGMAVVVDVEDDTPDVVRRRRLNKEVAEALKKVLPSMEVKDKLWDLTQTLSKVSGFSVVVIPGVMLPEDNFDVGTMIKKFCEDISKPVDEVTEQVVGLEDDEDLVESGDDEVLIEEH
jgi:hypothetical protein